MPGTAIPSRDFCGMIRAISRDLASQRSRSLDTGSKRDALHSIASFDVGKFAWWDKLLGPVSASAAAVSTTCCGVPGFGVLVSCFTTAKDCLCAFSLVAVSTMP